MSSETRNADKTDKSAAKQKGQYAITKMLNWFIDSIVYDLVTWVAIAFCIALTLIYLFAVSPRSWRGVFWSLVWLLIFVGVMIAVRIDQHFFRGTRIRPHQESDINATTNHDAATPTPSQRSNRPSVGVMAVNIKTLRVGQPVHIEIVWRNGGTSIAHHVKSEIRVELLWQDNPDPKFAYEGMRSNGSLAIDGIAITPVFSNVPLTQGGWNAIQMGALQGTLRKAGQWLFLYARVTYDDGAGNDYFTEFCGRYNPQLRGFETCDVFNEAS